MPGERCAHSQPATCFSSCGYWIPFNFYDVPSYSCDTLFVSLDCLLHIFQPGTFFSRDQVGAEFVALAPTVFSFSFFFPLSEKREAEKNKGIHR